MAPGLAPLALSFGPVTWEIVASIVHVGLAGAAIAHILLHKDDPRSALGWVAFCALFPIVGAVSYYLFGVNRIRTRAASLAPTGAFAVEPAPVHPGINPALGPELQAFAAIGSRVTRRPLLAGNRFAPLKNGEEAYPAMLEAIAAAQERVLLASYIFESDDTGRSFVEALARAHRRGVLVRVLVDGVGERYSLPWVSRLLRREGVPVARFLPPRMLPPTPYVNLRNHRKILVADDTGFTGGMNIGDRHLVAGRGRGTRDLHFRLGGPVVHQLEQVFREDWRFATGERLSPRPAPATAGSAHARVIVDGPNEDLDKLLQVLIGTISSARQEILMLTPYFVPPRELTTALAAACLRGVGVRLLLPARSNLPYVDWATRRLLPELLEIGLRVRLQPPPFDHSKLLVIDGRYAQIGSANLDARSLRLNFEVNTEILDRETAGTLAAHAHALWQAGEPLTLAGLDTRPLPIRLRDATAWLLAPYL